MKYKSSIYSSSGVKGKYKVFVHADAHMYTHINAGGMINSSPDICSGELKSGSVTQNK